MSSGGGDASGYIAFLDADDMWARNFLDENVRVYLSHKYDLIGFLSGRCNRTVTRHSLLSTMNEGVYAGGNTSIWLNARQHFGAGFYSIKTLERYNVRFPLGIKDNEDWMFAMQFRYLADEICLVNKLLYLYRNNIASVTHKRISAIPKYVPMIYGYLALDQLMGKYHNNQRGELKEGRAMAAVYIVDMFEEHYKQLGSKRELDKVMKDNPEFEKLILSPFAINRPDSGLRWQAMTAKPIVFIIKHNIKGVVKFIVQKTYRILMSIPPVARYLDRLRYPIII